MTGLWIMIQRREVKSPFTKEERQGVFVTIEESRERRNKLQIRKPRSKMTEEEKVVAKQRMDDYENNVTEQQFKNELRVGMEREQEFKEDLKYRMEQDALHPHCDCPICQEAHKKFEETPDVFLDERWQSYLEQINRKPCTDEELDTVFAKYGLVIERDRKSQ